MTAIQKKNLKQFLKSIIVFVFALFYALEFPVFAFEPKSKNLSESTPIKVKEVQKIKEEKISKEILYSRNYELKYDIDGTYFSEGLDFEMHDIKTVSGGCASLGQNFWPTQILAYFGVAAGAASGWAVGDSVCVGGAETFMITCIAIGAPSGGATNCGNSRATFDIVVVDHLPTVTYPAGTSVCSGGCSSTSSSGSSSSGSSSSGSSSSGSSSSS